MSLLRGQPKAQLKSDTLINWLIKAAGNNLPIGNWIHINEITDLGIEVFCTSTNKIGLEGFGGFLNPDFQDVGDYSGVFGLTGINKAANRGVWHPSLEYLEISYINLVNGPFIPGQPFTMAGNGSGIIIADTGSILTVLYTSGYNQAATTLTSGSTTAQPTGFNSTPLIDTGDIVFWNGEHYQFIGNKSGGPLDGTDPATNTAGYTLLPKTTPDMGYIAEWDEIHFVPSIGITYRADKLRNKITMSVDDFQWGNTLVRENICEGNWLGAFNCINQRGQVQKNFCITGFRLTISNDNVATIDHNTFMGGGGSCTIANSSGNDIQGCLFNNSSTDPLDRPYDQKTFTPIATDIPEMIHTTAVPNTIVVPISAAQVQAGTPILLDLPAAGAGFFYAAKFYVKFIWGSVAFLNSIIGVRNVGGGGHQFSTILGVTADCFSHGEQVQGAPTGNISENDQLEIFFDTNSAQGDSNLIMFIQVERFRM